MSEKNFNRVEFVITYACTGRCKHCSQGDHSASGGCIDTEASVDALRYAAGKYDISSVMTFGGEALIYPDAVCKIHSAARELGIEKRQLITNGFFSRDGGYIAETVTALRDCGINDLLLSVDAFHEESIPMEYVRKFAQAVVEKGIPARLNPAWLVSREDDNPYNLRTREIISEFESIGIREGRGNIIFPKGNALRYFSEYFDGKEYDPYEDDSSICFDPDSDLKGAW